MNVLFALYYWQAPTKKEPTPAFNDLVGPSVDFLNSTVPAEPVKSTIGVRKIQPKKGVSILNGVGGVESDIKTYINIIFSSFYRWVVLKKAAWVQLESKLISLN